ncbi:hypothetical protein C8J56DRAFT_930199 [Mycena floridula]|nr:hypothetical protein C8J56DRAFT_930199 [Mycena floridula]
MSPRARRRSVDSSSSSSSSSSSDESDSSKKRAKKEKEKKRLQKLGAQSHNAGSVAHGNSSPMMPPVPMMPIIAPHQNLQHNSPGYTAPPPSGYRIPLNTNTALPSQQQFGVAPCHEADGAAVYFGSALFEKSVHPCKITPHLSEHCLVPYGGGEHWHHGRFDLLPFDPNTMELVRTSWGEIPHGRRPIEGGYEEDGARLYHGVSIYDGVRIPGKVGAHLRGVNFSYAGAEHTTNENYEILCWR